jgi:diguanylate cyclase (GGDEF)-like protein
MRGDTNRALIVGGGHGGSAMLEMLLEEKMVHVVGVVDTIEDAPGMELARAAGIPTYTDLDQALEVCEPCMVFNLTGDLKVNDELMRKKHSGGIIGGVEALLMWRMITRMQQMQRDLHYQANHDPLTGAYNRRCMLDFLRQGVSEAIRYDIPYSMALIDIDHFKEINDNFGHAAGDAVLRELVRRLQTCIRTADLLGRWGGEEFLVLLPHVDSPHAALATHKWLTSVSAIPMDLGNNRSKTITFSAGVAGFDRDWADGGVEKAMDSFLERVDNRLYRAKQAGRNRIVGADISQP